jgi:hypothetical protein
MYHFTFDGKQFRVRFVHEQELPEPGKHLRVIGKQSLYKGFTTCLIEEKLGPKAWTLVSQGEAWCSVQDQFSRATGRKYSTARATECGCPPGTKDSDHIGHQAWRSAIFQAMFKTT